MKQQKTVSENRHELEEKYKFLFREHFTSMCAFAYRFFGDYEISRDAVHDVFCKLWESDLSWCEFENVKGFLYMTVRNRCLDILRQSDTQQRYLKNMLPQKTIESSEWFETEKLREEIYCLLDSAIKKLPPRSQEILLLKISGMKNQEIAKKLGISINTLNTLKTHSYKILRELLKEKFITCFILFLNTEIPKMTPNIAKVY